MRIPVWSIAAPVMLAAVGLMSCGGVASSKQGADVRLQGAGASFPFPMYSKWFKVYSVAHQNVQIDYQSVGSGAGVKNFIDKTVDFGASDMAMKPEEIARVQGGAQLLPLTAGNIVLTYNVPGLTDLKLSREAYAGIFLGKVKKWNDPAIAAAEIGRVLRPGGVLGVVWSGPDRSVAWIADLLGPSRWTSPAPPVPPASGRLSSRMMRSWRRPAAAARPSGPFPATVTT